MKNTLENKAKFFAQYWGQEVLFHNNLNQNLIIHGYNLFNLPLEEYFLELKPLSSISDDDAIEVAKLAHQINDGWEIEKRDPKTIFLKRNGNVNDVFGLRIGLFYSADMTAWHRFMPTKRREKTEQYPVNLCIYNLTDTKPLPYIAIVDYLRSKGYALDWNGISVKEQIELGWIKLKK